MLDRPRALADGPILSTDFEREQPLLVHNALSITGSALAPAGIDAVKVRIADHEYTASFGHPARDRLADLPDFPGANRSRFVLDIDTSDWGRGTHPFEVVAVDRAGAETSVTAEAHVVPYQPPPFGDEESLAALAAGRPAMWCEAPDVYVLRELRPPLEISGWAASPVGIEEVVVTVDGRLRIPALHGLVRPDLLARLGEDVAADSGFALRLDPADCPPGWRELTIVAIARDGQAAGVTGMVNCLPAAPPSKVQVTAPFEPLPWGAAQREEHLTDTRFVPKAHRDTSLGAEHEARYSWAATLVRDAEVLDAGCGTGHGTALLAPRARRTIGVDCSPAAVSEATQLGGGEGMEFREGDLLALPFDDESFDVVVCFEAIEWVADPQRALDELRRVLRPGGLLLVSAANRSAYPPGNPLHRSELTSDELHAELDDRFANVIVHRQQTFSASLLGSSGVLGSAYSAEIDARVTKLVSCPPGKELYAVAVASDGGLPPEPVRLVLGEAFDMGEQARLGGMWQERCIRAEAEAVALRIELRFARRAQRLAVEQAARLRRLDDSRRPQ